MEKYTDVFKVLSDKTRLKIMWLLNSVDSKATVSEIVDVIGESHFNVSRHMQILKNAGLLILFYIIPRKISPVHSYIYSFR